MMILIFAIGFSGYSAAAHALAMGSCDMAKLEQNVEQDKNCTGHQSHQTSSQQDGQAKKSAPKGACIDCHHCCAAPMASIPAIHINLPPLVKLQHLLPSFGYSDHLAFSLLRPPRNLV